MRIGWEEQQGRALVSDETGRVLFDTEGTWQESGKTGRSLSSWRLLEVCEKWTWTSGAPSLHKTGRWCASREARRPTALDEGRIRLLLVFPRRHLQSPGKRELRLPFCGDFLRIFVNGRPVAKTAPPMKECRGPTKTRGVARPGTSTSWSAASRSIASRFQVPLRAGRNRIDILCCALGLIKGDWMISGPMTSERKGIWSDVYLDEKPLIGWEIRAGLSEGFAKAMLRAARNF